MLPIYPNLTFLMGPAKPVLISIVQPPQDETNDWIFSDLFGLNSPRLAELERLAGDARNLLFDPILAAEATHPIAQEQ